MADFLITVLNDDGSQSDIEVQAADLGAAVDAVIDAPGVANVIEVYEQPPRGGGEHVLYCWTEDGMPERCRVSGATFDGVECFHCLRPIDGVGVELHAPDGDVYRLHRECAYEGCGGFDREAIDRACDGVRRK